MLNDSEATNIVTRLIKQWISAIGERNFDWLEQHLADDFLFSAHPFPDLKLRKREFIDLDKKIAKAELEFASIKGEMIGDILISLAVADIKEEKFSAELGHGLPAISELSQMMSGHRLVYASAWRRLGESWQCYDHHVLGFSQKV